MRGVARKVSREALPQDFTVSRQAPSRRRTRKLNPGTSGPGFFFSVFPLFSRIFPPKQLRDSFTTNHGKREIALKKAEKIHKSCIFRVFLFAFQSGIPLKLYRLDQEGSVGRSRCAGAALVLGRPGPLFPWAYRKAVMPECLIVDMPTRCVDGYGFPSDSKRKVVVLSCESDAVEPSRTSILNAKFYSAPGWAKSASRARKRVFSPERTGLRGPSVFVKALIFPRPAAWPDWPSKHACGSKSSPATIPSSVVAKGSVITGGDAVLDPVRADSREATIGEFYGAGENPARSGELILVRGPGDSPGVAGIRAPRHEIGRRHRPAKPERGGGSLGSGHRASRVKASRTPAAQAKRAGKANPGVPPVGDRGAPSILPVGRERREQYAWVGSPALGRHATSRPAESGIGRLALLFLRGVAQLASAPGLGPGGCKFESCRLDQKMVAALRAVAPLRIPNSAGPIVGPEGARGLQASRVTALQSRTPRSGPGDPPDPEHISFWLAPAAGPPHPGGRIHGPGRRGPYHQLEKGGARWRITSWTRRTK